PTQYAENSRKPPTFDDEVLLPRVQQSYALKRQSLLHAPLTPVVRPTPKYGTPASRCNSLPIAEMHSTSPTVSKKRKAQRVSQACDSCRQLKAKCDERLPCKNCRIKNITCVYRDIQKKQPEKVNMEILNLMNALKSQISSEFSQVDTKIRRRRLRTQNRLYGICNHHLVVAACENFYSEMSIESRRPGGLRIDQEHAWYHSDKSTCKTTTDGTVEDRIVELQRRKRAQVNVALDEAAAQSIGELSTDDLAYLCGLVGLKGTYGCEEGGIAN
ncbi:hypothetical protein JX266_014173, partial [Neoarthrinium moseri]